MSDAKKYDRSYKEQSVKPALKIGVKRAGEELKVPYGTLYGWVQAAKKGIYTDTRRCHIRDGVAVTKFMYWLKTNIGKTKITEISAAEKLLELRKEQDEQCAGIGDKWQDYDRLFIKWDGSPMNNNTPYFRFKEFCEKNSIRFCVIHSLRHLHASLLINAGVDVVAVSWDLGHSQVSTTTNIYCHMFQEAQARTSQAIADALIFDKKEKQGGEKAEFPA